MKKSEDLTLSIQKEPDAKKEEVGSEQTAMEKVSLFSKIICKLLRIDYNHITQVGWFILVNLTKLIRTFNYCFAIVLYNAHFGFCIVKGWFHDCIYFTRRGRFKN